MAGLNFSTTTIINSLDNVKVLGDSKKVLRLGKGVDLVAENVKVVRKTVGYKPKMAVATVNVAGLTPGDYRLDVTLGTDGAAPLIFAAPSPVNGTPFWVGIHVDTTGVANAGIVADSINKNKLFVLGEKLLNCVALKTTGESTTYTGVIELTAASEYIRFRDIKLVKFTAATENAPEKVEVVSGAVNVTEKGLNGFGTYSHIIKDLRLPTGANLAFNHLREDETPTPGTVYTQYVFEYEAPSLIRGTQVVGSVNTSHTQHVAWVAKNSVTAFDALLSSANLADTDTNRDNIEQYTVNTDSVVTDKRSTKETSSLED